MPRKKSTAAAAAAAAADGTSSNTFTDGEMKLLVAIFEGMGAEVKKSINWEGVQKKLGHAGVKTTKEKFRLLCLKYEWCEYAKDGKDGSTKRSAEEEDSDAAGAGGGGGGGTDEAKGDVKKPKPRGRPPKKQKKAAEEDENDDGGVSEEGA